VIDSIYNLIFRCGHHHTSFPLRPQTKAGQPPGDMCVVCLDCGKRFRYDWELMRIGEPLEDMATDNVRAEDVAAPKEPGRKSKLRYVLAACALPVVWLIGKTAISRARSKTERKPL
jgi:hypothetical protein